LQAGFYLKIIKKITFLKLHAITLPVFLAAGMVLLDLSAKNLYRAQIGALMKLDVNWIAAIIKWIMSFILMRKQMSWRNY
jgi:uncharacterized membrane protein